MPYDRGRFPRAYARALTALRLAYPEEFTTARSAHSGEDNLASYRHALADLKAAHVAEFRARCALEMADGVDILRRAPSGPRKRARAAS